MEIKCHDTDTVKRYKVTIGGESYFLVSDEPEEHIRKVAEFVDQHIREGAQADDIKRVAVLIAMQCASKMLLSTERMEQYTAANDKLIERLSLEIARLT